MAILTQFIFRLSFGLALGMALTSPRAVTSGYYRNHLYVLLGLNVLAAMVAITSGQFQPAPGIVAAVLSYVGAVFWLYEKPRAGIAVLSVISAVCLSGAWAATNWQPVDTPLRGLLMAGDVLSSGLLLGITMAAMFLGHWYLNSPTMAIVPLERLVVMMGGAAVIRGLVEAGILAHLSCPGDSQFGAAPVHCTSLAVRHRRPTGAGRNDLSDAEDPQHAKRDGHSVRGRNRNLFGRTDFAAVEPASGRGELSAGGPVRLPGRYDLSRPGHKGDAIAPVCRAPAMSYNRVVLIRSKSTVKETLP